MATAVAASYDRSPVEAVAPRKATRIVALDSLRGIAALFVVFHHLDYTLNLSQDDHFLGPVFHKTPLRLLIDGHSAVILFFVLSGFALSISIGKNFRYPTYLIRRVCRLMLPCIAAILLSAAVYLLIAPKPIVGLGPWLSLILWNDPVSWGLIGRHILMTGVSADSSLDPVLWSLVVELRISLIFPVLYFLVKGRTKLAAIVAAGMFFTFHYLEAKSGNVPTFYNSNLKEVVENLGLYMPFFILGIVARENLEAIRRFVARFHWALVLLALVVGLKLQEAAVDWEIGIGSFLIIVLCVCAPYISRVLSHAVVEWLGRISYSLYLVHLIVLGAVFHLFYGKANSVLLSCVVVAGSLLLAHVFHVLVEAPSIKLGRQLTAKKMTSSQVTFES